MPPSTSGSGVLVAASCPDGSGVPVAGPAGSNGSGVPAAPANCALPCAPGSAPHQDNTEARDMGDTEKPARRARGTAGTFAGRRPPKDAEKLTLFLAKKAAYEKEKADTKEKQEKKSSGARSPSMSQKDFWVHMSESLKGNGGSDGFKEAVLCVNTPSDNLQVLLVWCTFPRPRAQ